MIGTAMLFALSVTVVNPEGHVIPAAKCIGEGKVVHCSAPGFEPLDVAQPAGEQLTVVLPKSRTVTVRGVVVKVAAEWRRPDKDGLVLLARRDAPANGVLQVDVAMAPRVLTFVWPDGARTSTFIAPVANEVTVVKPVRGSEAVAWLGMRSIRPVRMELRSGDATRMAAWDRAGLVSVSGIAPGKYLGAVTYSSGITIRVPGAITVGGEQTVQIRPAMVPEAGALEVELDAATCRELLPEQTVTATVLRDGTNEVAHVAELGAPDCRTLVDGLAPGEYQVGSERVSIRADRVEELVLTVDVPIVEGTALFGDQPAGDVSLRITAADFERVVKTDREGRFTVSLPRPGTYDVNIRTSELVPGESRPLQVSGGRQSARLVFSPGRLIVIATSSGGAFTVPIQIEVEGDAYRSTGIATGDEFRAEFLGVPPGTYRISAFGPPDWKLRQPKEVTLDAVLPEREVTVMLERENARRLMLVDDGGQPVSGARVQAGVMLVKEDAPGSYELPATAGDRLSVRAAGFLPVCRDLAPADREIVVVLKTGSFTTAIRLDEMPEGVLGRIAGLPGSTCPVGVQSLDHQLVPTKDGAELRLNGLPAGRYVYVSAGGTQTVLHVP